MNGNNGDNPFRLGNRKTVQVMVILTILAWATTTLLKQWGFGQEIGASQDASNSAVTSGQASPAPDNGPASTDPVAATATVAPSDATATVAPGVAMGNPAAASSAGDAAAENLPPAPMAPISVPEPIGAEKFVPGFAGPAPLMGTLELRGEATVYGSDVKLKQICRWSDVDATAFAPIADLTLFHLSSSTPFKAIHVDEIRRTLHDAGINVATIDFAGATSCTVSRSDVQVDEHEALQEWIDAKNADRQGTSSSDPSAAPTANPIDSNAANSAGTQSSDAAPSGDSSRATTDAPATNSDGPAGTASLVTPAPSNTDATGADTNGVTLANTTTSTSPASSESAEGPMSSAAPVPSASTSASGPSATAPSQAAPGSASASADAQSCQTLRSLITADACTRLGVCPDDIEMTFNPADEKVLSLAAPYFRFNLTPRRVFNLGDVSWDVLIVTDGGTQKTTIDATARAWQTELVVNKPLAFGEVIQDSDVDARRVLVDHVSDEHVLTKDETVGQLAARDLKPGVVMTARLVDPVPLCKPGQLVTVTVQQGGVQIRMVARALEGGGYGQTVRVRNETTQDVLDVILTGPQEARLGPTTSVSFAGN
jgi:flagella basal body P-ring formation protein FlgA